MVEVFFYTSLADFTKENGEIICDMVKAMNSSRTKMCILVSSKVVRHMEKTVVTYGRMVIDLKVLGLMVSRKEEENGYLI